MKNYKNSISLMYHWNVFSDPSLTYICCHNYFQRVCLSLNVTKKTNIFTKANFNTLDYLLLYYHMHDAHFIAC